VQLHRRRPAGDGGGDDLMPGAGAGGRAGRATRGGAAVSSGRAAGRSGEAAGSADGAELGLPIATATAQLRRCGLRRDAQPEDAMRGGYAGVCGLSGLPA
jgi:hypothetical protein